MIRATSFGQFVDFASPAFFDVVPAGTLMGEARRLVGAYRDRRGFEAAVEDRQRALDRTAIPVVVETDRREAALPADASEEQRKRWGEAILQLYFHQILSPEPTLLDLSQSRWSAPGDDLEWRPGRGHVVWDPDFGRAIGDMYRGFYVGTEADLRDALARLDIEPTADLFLRHFGEGDQRRVEFRVAHFTQSFHDVFVRCRDRGLRLHGGFLALGIHLATLYQTLESLAAPLDVRDAFEAAAGDPGPGPAGPSLRNGDANPGGTAGP